MVETKKKETRPLCLITGVGDATGAALVRRFVQGGYRVAMIARNAKRLATLEQEIDNAEAYICDVGDLGKLTAVIKLVQKELGSPTVVIHNAVAHSFDRFLDADPSELERNFRVNVTAFLYMSRALAPAMVQAGKGAIIATGNTASHRGVPNYALFAPTKAAQRIFAEAMARDLGPQGVHVGYVTVDAAIDVTWLGPAEDKPAWLLPPSDWPFEQADFYAKPLAIADEVYHLAHQDRSTWAFDMVVRPFAEHW